MKPARSSKDPATKTVRILACLAGCAALGMSALLFEERRMIGFPDGFVTEDDRTRKALLAASSAASLLAGLWFMFLGGAAPQRTGKRLCVTGLAYGFLVTLAFIVDHHLLQRSGGGG